MKLRFMERAKEFKMASKRLAEEIARTRDKPIGFKKLF